MAYSRLPRTLARLLLVPLLLWGCGDGSDPGTTGGSRNLEVSLSIAGPFDGQPAASLADAFDQADNLIVRVLIPGRSPIVETFDFDPGEGDIRARVTIPIPAGATAATIIVELRSGNQVLFGAQQDVTLGAGGDFQLDLELQPTPGSIELGSPWTVTTLGVPVQLDGVVRFATGGEIPGAPLVWSTEATGITITPDGVVTALANGTWTVRAESGGIAATGEVVVNAAATITSVLPSPVVLGQPTDLLIEGSSLQGATEVTVCGTAEVGPGLEASDDGTLVEVQVTWAIFDEAGESQVGERCVRVSTPQGDAEGSVELVEPPAETVVLSPTSANLALGGTLQLETEVRDGFGNLLSDDQVVFSSDKPDVASVSEDGLVVGQSAGTAVVTATAGPATASATIVVGGGVVGGTVTSDGEPLEGITVTLTGVGEDAVTTTGADGQYQFVNVAPGTHTVSISDIPAAHRFETTSQTVEIVSTETVTANFAGTAAPGTVSGTVTIDGSPAEGITVTLTGDGHSFSTVTDADGRYRFEPPPGTYVLAIPSLQEGVFDPASFQIQVTSGQVLVIDFVGIAAHVDVQVSKSVDVTSAEIGDVVTFTVGVANLGTAPATGLSVLDPVPAGLTFSSATASTGSYDAETGIWTVGALDAGADGTLTLSATVDQGSGQETITNTASVASLDQEDSDPSNDEASASFAVSATVDLVVTKFVNDANPNTGDAVAFTVTVTNNGPANATGLELTDVLPAGLTFVSSSTMTGAYDEGTGIWTVGTLGVEATATLTLDATVDAGQGGSTLTNTATVTAVDQTEIAPGDESASVDVVVQQVDLSVVKTSSVPEAPEGSTFTYTVVVSNATGFDAATNVLAADPVPAGLSYSDHTVSQGTYDPVTGAWTLGTLAAGASATLTLHVTVDAGTAGATGATITNTAAVTAADQEDVDLAYPSGSVDVVVPATLDMVVAKSVDNANPNVGDAVAFTVTATNNGPTGATSLELTDALPAGLTFVSATPTTGSYDPGTGVWTIGTLGVEATATLTLNATVDAGQGGSTLTNTATVTGVDQEETAPGDESASVDVVVQQVDLSVVKTSSVTEAAEGSTVTYTVVVSNATGFDAATNVLASDPIPAGVTYATHTEGQGTYDPGTGTWTIGTVAAGASATLTLEVTVDAGIAGTTGATITNTATVTSADQEDVDLAYPSGSVDVIVPAAVDLVVAKSVDNANPTVGDPVAFTVTVTNNGPATATGLGIADALPAGLTFVSATATTGTYDPSFGAWTVGTLGVGATATLTLNATVDAGTGGSTLTNTATVGAVDQEETAPGDETASVNVVVQQVDLSVVKTSEVAEAPEGSIVSYTVEISNATGFDAATNVLASDPIPAGVTYASHTVSQGTYDPGTGAWTVGTVAAGATATLNLDVTVDAGTAGTTITNTATVTAADQEDVDLAYPSGSVAVTAVHNPIAHSYTTAGNTELVAGAFTAPATPHATDPDNLLVGTPTLTATAGTFATTNGGSVTIEADGDFSYTPAAGDPGPDSFDYTVQTGESATVTITLTDMVWYVDNTAGTGGTGVSNDPFDGTAAAGTATADGDGSIIYVDHGDGTSTGYTDTSLRIGQSLVGEGVALTVAGVGTLAPAGTPPFLSGGVEGTAITLADGVSVTGVDVTVPASGVGLQAFNLVGGVTVDGVAVFGGGTGNTGVRLSSSTGTYDFTNLSVSGTTVSAITVTGGSPTASFDITPGSVTTTAGRAFQVQNTTGGSVTFTGGGISSMGGTGVRINGNAGTVDVQNVVTITSPVDTAVVVGNNSGAVSIPNLAVTTNGWPGVRTVGNTATVTLGGDVDVTGETGLSFTTSDHAVSFNSVTVDNTGVPIPGIQISSSTGSTSVFLLDVTTDGAAGVNLTGSGTFTTNNVGSSIVTNGASAFVTNSPSTGFVNDLFIGMGTLTVTSPAGSGIVLTDATGTFTAAGGSISDVGPAGTSSGVSISGGSVDFTYGGSISNTITPTARSVTVSGLAGNASFNGPITDTGAGVSLTNNTGTMNFTGGLAIDATTASAFSATGGGTVNVTGAGNTVSTTTGIGVEIDNTNIGANGVTFESVSASTGATSGIRLVTTFTSGPFFTVTGTGTPGSGGTISGTTGYAVDLTSSHGVDLNYMDVSGGSGVRALGSSNVSLRNSTVTNTISGLELNGIIGTSEVTGTTVSGTDQTSNAVVQVTAGTFDLDLTASSFNSSVSSAGSGLRISTSGNASATVLADGTSFNGNTDNGFYGFARDQSSLDITVLNNSSFDGNTFNGFEVEVDQDGTITLDVRNSTFSNNSDAGVSLLSRTTSTTTAGLRGTFDGNTILDNQPSANGVGGIETRLAGAARNVLAVTNNTMRQIDGFEGDGGGMSFFAGVPATVSSPTLDLWFDGNALDHGPSASGTQLAFINGSTATTCLALATDMTVNTVHVNFGTGVEANSGSTGTFNVEELDTGELIDGDPMTLHIGNRTTITTNDATPVTTSGMFTSVATCERP